MGEFNNIRFQPNRSLLKEVSADRLNAIVAEIKKNTVRGERGITVRQSGTGTYIGLAASFQSAKQQKTSQPWDMFVESYDADGGVYTVGVEPGTLGNYLLPINWDEKFELEKDKLYYAKAAVSTDGQSATELEIRIEEEEIQLQTPLLFSVPTEVEFLFGVFFNQPYRTGFYAQGIAQQSYTIQRTNPAPGEYPLEVYYTLQ